MFIETRDGTKLYAKDWGKGSPVVMVHGWPLDADMWEYNARVIGEAGHRVVMYDRRGFGRSDQPWSGYDYDTMADDLGSVMDAFDLRGATLVGFSMGGGEVVRYLARHGADRVAKAVLVSSVAPYLLKTADNPDGVEKSVFETMVTGLMKDRPGFLAAFGKAFYGAGLLNFSVSSDILQWSSMMAMLASPKATIDCVRAFAETDFRADCAAITVPTLLIHGDADQTVPIDSSSRRAVKLIPGARLVEYSGAPHALMYTERDRFNRDLLGFLGS